MYDHAVFATYSLCFMSFLLIVIGLLMTVDAHGAIIGTLVAVAPPVHMYCQLRGAYRPGRINAGLRTVVLLLFAGIAALVFVFLLVGLGMTD